MEYSDLKRKGRALLADGDIKSCLDLFEEALKITPDDERIQKKVETLRQALEEEQAEEGNGEGDVEEQNLGAEMKELCPGYFLHSKIYSRLFPYQKEGLKWMYNLFCRKKGGVLGDDMGLGKTVQVVSYLAGLFDMEKIKSVLLIMPVSLIGNWMSEFEKWAPGICAYDYHSSTKRERQISLKKVMNRGGVILTSYGMVTTRSEELCANGGRKFVWDYIILDEGHKIKNPTKTQSAVFSLLANNRLILTGTAVQNNLGELWSLYHFTHQGTLFGNKAGFKQDFENPINRGREKDAKPGEREMGVQLAKQLKQMINPYFLRRTKAEVFKNGDGPKIDSHKEDLVLWTYLSEIQQELYRDFLESDQVKDILMTSKSPLVQLNILKKICDHPRLLPKKACVQLGLCDGMTEEEIRTFLEDDTFCPFTIDDVTDETLLNESGKMKLLLHLMENLKENGHRTLIFSTSRRILDMIQRILRSRRFTISRLDGTITKNSERKRIVDEFQNQGSDVFLLTTQVGGVGLTLTNADRVIIYDPNWNPATDAQAVDRAFRIGQKRDVLVYRLITCGTVEEKIYARQIFKDSIIKQTTGNQKDPTRYFTRNQLRDLFVLNDPLRSETQVQLNEMHTKKNSKEIDSHIDFLLGTQKVFGVSHHDLMFSTEEEKENIPEEQRLFISNQVERARVLREKESEIMSEDLRKNPYLVPAQNFLTAASRNAAASMPSTVNPANLRDRPTKQPDFIDLSQNDESDDDVIVMDEGDVKTEITYQGKKQETSQDGVESYVILDSDEEFDFKEEAKEIQSSIVKSEAVPMETEKTEPSTSEQNGSDDDIKEIFVVRRKKPTTPQEEDSSSSETAFTTARMSSSPLDESFNFTGRKRKQNRVIDSDSSMEESNEKATTSSPIPDMVSQDDDDDLPLKKKRKSVATFKRKSSSILDNDSETSNQSRPDSANERQRHIEEAAYDEAFEAADDVDESIIEKTILERSQNSQESDDSFIVEDSFVDGQSAVFRDSGDSFVMDSDEEDS